MGLSGGSTRLTKRFSKGVNYSSGDIGEDLFDSNNLIILDGKLVTRPPKKQYNSATLGAAIDSLSFFVSSDGATKKLIAKAGTALYADSLDTVFASIKTGLTSGNKHDGINVNGRHIIAAGDGLYSYDGTTFADLGIPTPTAPTTAVGAAAGSLSDKTWEVVLTYEATGIGVESNAGTAGTQRTTASPNSRIELSAIPESTHPLVDKVNIYLKNVTDAGSYLFVAQIDNGTATYNIDADPTSSQTPPTTHSVPISGGGKYLTLFNRQVVNAGNSTYPSDVFFSLTDIPDAWGATGAATLFCPGDGPITGVATGLYNGDTLNQYLVIFKKRSTHIYTEDLSGNATFMTIDQRVGCVSHKTIIVKNGDVWFLSDSGWRVIRNGQLIKDHLSDGKIDDIFRTDGFVYSLNKQTMNNTFSVYYSELDSYMTWVGEGSSTTYNKCYNYHFKEDAFMPLTLAAVSACAGENTSGEEVIYMGDSAGYIYKYDIRQTGGDDSTLVDPFILDVSQLDVDQLEGSVEVAIDQFVYFNWLPYEDFDASYNFRDFILETITDPNAASNSLTVRAFVNYNRSESYEYSYDLTNSQSGFVLDLSRLDEDVLADDRARQRSKADINRTGINLLIGIFYNDSTYKLQLLASHLNLSKNGNSN